MEANLARSQTKAQPADHRFFTTMAITCSAVILAGFASSYLPKLSRGTPVLPIIHVHGAIFVTWLLLYITQTLLVGRERIALHRTLGTAMVLFSILMFCVGLHAALTVTRLGDRGLPGQEFADADAFLLVNVATILEFVTLVAAGWYFRKQAQTHKRLMVLATVSLMGPGIARIPIIGQHIPTLAGAVLLFLIIGPIYDFVTRKKIHRAWLGGLVVLVPAPPVLAAIGATSAWHAIAGWLMRSPL
jgi:hypothetical protein